ncbi:MAG TPA: alpha/beta hydrolase [Blastocatellia bacterium]|jgi:pimeloyl-ACP methyl ester carboxylesterase
MSMTSGVAEVNGTKLYYEIMGEGHPLVMISGGSLLDRRGWDNQFIPFSEKYKVIRYDVRGIGKSDDPVDTYSPLEDLHELLKALNVESAYLMGLSLGGRLAIDYTLEHPEMVDALILASSGPSGVTLSDEYMKGLGDILAAYAEGGAQGAIRAIMAIESSPQPDNVAAREKMKQILSDNARVFDTNYSFIALMQQIEPPAIGRLSEIRCPALTIRGGRDHPEHHSMVDILESGIAGVETAIIPDGGHTISVERPEQFNEIVLGFLSKLQSV